jgi:hypothetical protein
MTAAEIARALAGRRCGWWWSCRCPAHDDRSPSLSIRDGDRGLIVRCWAGCDARDVLAELRRLGLPPADYRPVSVRTGHARDDSARNVEIARRIWGGVRDARGTHVARYLQARGITLLPPACLRYAPSLRRPDGTSGPAMVARIDGPDGEFYGVLRTWLDRDAAGIWRRRDRAMLGRAAGGAVRLARAAETLIIGEGIESCLAVMQEEMQEEAIPAWAAGSAGGIARLILPTIVRDVLVAVDRDANGTGERKARAAGMRWVGEGRRVRLIIPHVIGTDAADLIAGSRHAA